MIFLTIRTKIIDTQNYFKTKEIINTKKLHTVCEEASCPNISECWSKRHATFMIMGDTCTRACSFCNVKTGKPTHLDPLEPMKIALATILIILLVVVLISFIFWLMILLDILKNCPNNTKFIHVILMFFIPGYPLMYFILRASNNVCSK